MGQYWMKLTVLIAANFCFQTLVHQSWQGLRQGLFDPTLLSLEMVSYRWQ